MHCLQQVQLVIICVIGFLGLLRLITFPSKLASKLVIAIKRNWCFNFISLIDFQCNIFICCIFNYVIQGRWVSMGVYSDGSYGIQPGLIYSFPVTCEKGEWSIVQGMFSLTIELVFHKQ